MDRQQRRAGQQILVTGGAGFLGSHLVAQLVTDGAEVTVLDSFRTASRANLLLFPQPVQVLEHDIQYVDWDDVLTMRRPDILFHFAANAYVPPSVADPSWDFAINVVGTLRLLEALRLRRWTGTLVYASSAAVYGNPMRVPVTEHDLTVPVSPYGVGKLAAERYVAVFSQLYGLRTASLRLFSIYGPRQRKQVVYDVIDRLHRQPEVLLLHGDGTQVRDLCYVDDVVQAALLVAERGALQGEVYNVGSGAAYTIAELATLLCRLVDAQPRITYSGVNRPGDAERWTVDISRLGGLGYQPRVALERGLRQTVDWYRAAHADMLPH